jgi:hypothetical protein
LTLRNPLDDGRSNLDRVTLPGVLRAPTAKKK